jgi:polyvinyl alcohol dehydrogenase (cytochrome)
MNGQSVRSAPGVAWSVGMRSSSPASARMPAVRAVSVVLALFPLLALVFGSSASASGAVGAGRTASASAAGSEQWLVYHGNVGGSGNAGPGADLSSPKRAWRSPVLDGQLYGEPLVYGKRVYVATEDDTAYALSARNGKVVWRHHLATPVPSSDLPCGDISPTVGITSTPVIDPARNEIFMVADQDVGGTPRHVLYGLSTSKGTVELRQRVDPPHAYTPAILQRVSLTLTDGRVVFGYGGNSGDCSKYHGWVVSVPETGGTMRTFEADSGKGERQGAVWMGGAAPVVDKQGDVWATTGNGSVFSSSGPFDYGDTVLDLSPSMKVVQYFAPSNWYELNASDADLGSVSPAVLRDGYVVQGGKGQTIYLMKKDHLGGIGGAEHKQSGVCGSDIDGGTAYVGNVVYLPCESGVIALRVKPSTHTFHILWQTSTGAGGPPIVAGGLVWTISGGTLYGLDPSNGNAVQQLAITSNATDFPTPSVGDGRLLAPADNRVFAFSGS